MITQINSESAVIMPLLIRTYWMKRDSNVRESLSAGANRGEESGSQKENGTKSLFVHAHFPFPLLSRRCYYQGEKKKAWIATAIQLKVRSV